MTTKTVWHLALFFIGCAVSILHADEPTVVLQVNESSPYWSAKKPSGGFGSEIVTAISKEMGIKTRIEFIPLKRLVSNTSNNDVGNPLFYMNNQDFAAIIPIGIMYSAFFTYNKDSKAMLSTVTHKENRIGVIKGAADALVGLQQFGKFEESYSKESLFKKLKAGRIDIVMELHLVGIETIHTLFPNEASHFDHHVIPDSGSPIAIMIDSDAPNGVEIGKRYREGLHRILKNGVYKKIVEKYNRTGTIPAHYYNDLSKFEALYSSDLGGNGL